MIATDILKLKLHLRPFLKIVLKLNTYPTLFMHALGRAGFNLRFKLKICHYT